MMLNFNIGDIIDITIKNEQRIYYTVELFVGAGGLALSVEKAGFLTLCLAE